MSYCQPQNRYVQSRFVCGPPVPTFSGGPAPYFDHMQCCNPVPCKPRFDDCGPCSDPFASCYPNECCDNRPHPTQLNNVLTGGALDTAEVPIIMFGTVLGPLNFVTIPAFTFTTTLALPTVTFKTPLPSFFIPLTGAPYVYFLDAIDTVGPYILAITINSDGTMTLSRQDDANFVVGIQSVYGTGFYYQGKAATV